MQAGPAKKATSNDARCWTVGDTDVEVLNAQNGRLLVDQRYPRVCKKALGLEFRRLLELLPDEGTPFLLARGLAPHSSYRDMKDAAAQYAEKKTAFMKAAGKNWVCKPAEIGYFPCE